MNIFDNFLTHNLSHLPNDTQNTPTGALHRNHMSKHPINTQGRQNCLPCRQKNADDFLSGNTPGVMAFYAPEEQRYVTKFSSHPSAQPANIVANVRPDNATIEDAETVQRLVEWREEASY